MNLTNYLPCKELEQYVKNYLVIESQFGNVNKVLPINSFAMIFCFKGAISIINDINEFSLDSCTLTGLQKSIRHIKYAPKTSAIVIIFKENSKSAFFRLPLHELLGESVSLDIIFPKFEMTKLVEGLYADPSDKFRINRIEKFLLTKLKPSQKDKLITCAVDTINFAHGNIKVKEVIKQFSISQDAFEKRFRSLVGTSPKHYSQIVKINSVIRQYRTNPSFMDLAFENGYYDQPHFNKDFKNFTGQSPTNFFQSGAFW